MKITEAMVWWNVRDEHDKTGLPMIQVLRVRDEDCAKFMYLTKSAGACFAGWESADPAHLAAMLLGIFNLAVARDGVPSNQVHAEFSKIDEYRDWISEKSGPFADAYWQWEVGVK